MITPIRMRTRAGITMMQECRCISALGCSEHLSHLLLSSASDGYALPRSPRRTIGGDHEVVGLNWLC